MTRTWMAGVLAGAALICAAHPSVAQDKGKDRGRRTRKRVAGGLAAAVRHRAAGEGARAEGACHSGLPEGHEGRPRDRRAVWRRRPVEGWDRGCLLQDDGRFVRAAGGRPAVRLCDVLHERRRRSSSWTTRRVSKSASARASSWSTRAWRRPPRPPRSRTISTLSSSDRRA